VETVSPLKVVGKEPSKARVVYEAFKSDEPAPEPNQAYLFERKED